MTAHGKRNRCAEKSKETIDLQEEMLCRYGIPGTDVPGSAGPAPAASYFRPMLHMAGIQRSYGRRRHLIFQSKRIGKESTGSCRKTALWKPAVRQISFIRMLISGGEMHMKERTDLTFSIITKRPERFHINLPDDWGAGYENIVIACSWVFLKLPIRHKKIVLQPMLQAINLERYLERYREEIEEVACGGETGAGARELDYAWIISMNIQCVKYGVPFRFCRTGTYFRRGGKLYTVERADEADQAAKANIDYQSR